MWIDLQEVLCLIDSGQKEDLLSLRGLALVRCVVVPQTATGYIMMTDGELHGHNAGGGGSLCYQITGAVNQCFTGLL